ncbi:MAG: ATPase, T2SS/T4P/T4SS family [Planctomycetaceae bacterium]
MSERNEHERPDVTGSTRDHFARLSFTLPAERIRLKTATATDPPRSTGNRSSAISGTSVSDYLAVKGRLHEQLLDELSDEPITGQSEERLAAKVDEFVARVLSEDDFPLNEQERRQLADDLREETLGVGPLAMLMADPAVTDILVNGPETVYVERFGRLELTAVRFRDADHLTRIIQRIAARVGRRIDELAPMVDARLPDGSRVNATLPPVTIDGPTLSIRRFGQRRLRREELLRLGMFSPAMLEFLALVVRHRRTVLVAGGTGAGKSTCLGALCEVIPADERIVTIEDAAELILDQAHVIRMETRPMNLEGQGRIVARDLVINSLRMRPRPDHCGRSPRAEALDMLQAMNTGHDGSLTTVHSNSPRRVESARDNGTDGRAGPPFTRHPGADRRRHRHHCLCPPLRRWRATDRAHHRADRHGGTDTPIAGHLCFSADRPGRPASRGRVSIDRHRPTLRLRSARTRHRGSSGTVSLEQSAVRQRELMSLIVAGVLLMFAGVVGIVWATHRANAQSVARDRLDEALSREELDGPAAASLNRALRRYRWAALVAAGAVGLLLWTMFAFPWPYSLAFGGLAGLLTWQAESVLSERRQRKIEQQLADSIDMMVSAVKSGASLSGALESALEHLSQPLRTEFDLLVGRIRYGDAPLDVFHDLTVRVPLETFRLFSQTLAVNWSIGGRLAQTLANIGRTIRDRIELTRRMQAMTTQARLSVISVVATTYFIAALIWRNDPERMGDFLQSTIGSGLTIFAILMQGLGVVWISKLSRPRF